MLQAIYGFVEFQFLIGTLKTFLTKQHIRKVYYVSIPHRYAKNLNTALSSC